MKIILEGVDGVGKTTLAKKLAEVLRLEYCHDSKPRTYKEYLEELYNGKDRIYDRFFFGQFAGYQSAEERLISENDLRCLIDICKINGFPIILCYDKVENIVKRFKHNDDDKEWMEKTGFNNVEEFIRTIQTGFLDIAKVGGNYVNYLNMGKVINKDE